MLKDKNIYVIPCLGFLSVILVGWIVLMLPICNNGNVTPFDALFTAVSATCVNGLTTVNLSTEYSFLGQLAIAIITEIGAIGFVTFISFILSFKKKRMSLSETLLLGSALNDNNYGKLKQRLKEVIKYTIVIQIIGAILLAVDFIPRFGIKNGIWYSIFHSITAFCNAGFDLLGKTDHLYPSLTSYVGNPLVNLTIMGLIVTGGIGFLTWDDIYTKKYHFRQYCMQSKVILLTSLFLIFVPAAFFFFRDFAGMPVKERTLCALFQSVTTRTAGFNTADLSGMTGASQAIMIVLMMIGGAPGSTAGGMKITTFAVLTANASATFRQREDTQMFGRRVGQEVLKNASTILMMYLFLVLMGGMVISVAENLPISECLFETASAVGTVGLTLGITPQLGVLSKGILIALMFLGRVGGLTLVYAAMPGRKSAHAKMPLEKINVGEEEMI